MRGVAALFALVAGLALLAGTGVAWALRATPAPVPPPAGPVVPGSVAAPAWDPGAAGPVTAEPVGLTVDRAGRTLLTAPVLPVGVDASGAMGVPAEVATVGWYRFGPAPGAGAGSAVLAGHVDDREQGPGAFHDLAGLAPGDVVTIRRSAAPPVRYEVRAVRVVDKQALPAGELFARDGPPRLTLVTCGGPFDRGSRSYRDNVVVTAVPLVPPAGTS
ncbi:class F sortase [Pseudonocardia halophobica]|uniref:Class F sortase n=1 Tax=Pseudonocardia halophobica TaxID=29401 RepID=A0A9W6L5J4_9PSEU|nr:class F sortase [Pseudonocardia halophobica]GLL11454.1 class F sortase [Pseudonocardia halophobica]